MMYLGLLVMLASTVPYALGRAHGSDILPRWTTHYGALLGDVLMLLGAVLVLGGVVTLLLPLLGL